MNDIRKGADEYARRHPDAPRLQEEPEPTDDMLEAGRRAFEQRHPTGARREDR